MLPIEFRLSRAEIAKVDRVLRSIEERYTSRISQDVYKEGLRRAAKSLEGPLRVRTPSVSGLLRRSITTRVRKGRTPSAFVGYKRPNSDETLIPRAMTSAYGPGRSRNRTKTPSDQIRKTVRRGSGRARRIFSDFFVRDVEQFAARLGAANGVQRGGSRR